MATAAVQHIHQLCARKARLHVSIYSFIRLICRLSSALYETNVIRELGASRFVSHTKLLCELGGLIIDRLHEKCDEHNGKAAEAHLKAPSIP